MEYWVELRKRVDAENITIVRLSEVTNINRNRLSQILHDKRKPFPEEAASLSQALDGSAELLRSYCCNCPVKVELKRLLTEHGIESLENVERLLEMVKELENQYDEEIKKLWNERPPQEHPSYHEYLELIKRAWGRKNDLNQAALMYFLRS